MLKPILANFDLNVPIFYESGVTGERTARDALATGRKRSRPAALCAMFTGDARCGSNLRDATVGFRRYGILAAWCACALLLSRPVTAQPIRFNRDVRPILADKCYTCHGPDKRTRRSPLHFDNEAAAKAEINGHYAIVPGDPEHSSMVQRITSTDKATHMPPVYTGTSLTPAEINTLRQWIKEGAKWEKHWSFLPPERVEPPKVSDPKWPRNAIDNFVMARLDREGLHPSPEADRARLIRRVTLDLTGLPPTPAEIDAYLNDKSPNAYERVVDRLLASPRYGERMAFRWLEFARYADTNGYQTDGERFMWRWRDWVIDAYNRNMPFDRFTVRQLAGDLLPNPTLDDKIATGFNRNHRGNGEGGIIPEEYEVEYVVDRVDTTAMVWLGVTLGCSRCHDHKYDPFTQKDFYSFYAFFNSMPERGNAFKYGNSPPFIKAPLPEQQKRLAELDAQVSAAAGKMEGFAKLADAAQQKWEASGAATAREDASEVRELAAAFPEDKQYDGKNFTNAGDAANFGYFDRFSLSAWINPTAPDGAIVTRAVDVTEDKGFGLFLEKGKLVAALDERWLDDGVRVESADAIPLNQWHHVLMTYDGSRLASGVKLYIDGREQRKKVLVDWMNQNFKNPEPLRIGGGGGAEKRFHGRIRDVRVYGTTLEPWEAAVVAVPDSIAAIARLEPDKRTAAQGDKLRVWFEKNAASDEVKQARQALLAARKARDEYAATIPTVMVMQDLPKPREAHVLVRGAYDRPGALVTRAIPAVFNPPPAADRLALAKWIVSPENTLTARVVVNRYWQMLFGTGLVKTVEDFGSQGEYPSHPELLDWLATEYVRLGWDTKSLLKTIVTSATYRESAAVTPEALQRDPENRLLARGPRKRLAADEVRDQALAAAGLLVEKIGGPSVKPYQPEGLWSDLSGQKYVQSHGEGLYRRSLYTFWKRTAPPPTMVNFDAAARETCIVSQTRTNTPLQALDLMNDVQFVEAARKLAERMMLEGGASAQSRIGYGFRLLTARLPRAPETARLLEALNSFRDRFKTNPSSAEKLLSEGESAWNRSLAPSDLAAYSMVASLILNLDEAVTNE
jgi:hypothetical protein